ncbi:hypothetical protein [Paenibacillus camerounensis]|uniref:hypothetical protein n=1 Tax=Paenibacillus camerounensis TaxID=1243663 RepID=UPI0005AAEA45|nr:hypothetical protein [Paenibacillus camerounensis]
MITAGNMGGQALGSNGANSFKLPKYARTTFDYIIIAACYLFMPVGLLLALVRLLTSHYKNYRKPVNFSLLFHAFAGGFIEIIIFIIFLVSDQQYDFGGTGMLISLLIAFAVLFLLPAAVFAYVAAVSRHDFSQLAAKYIQLAGGGIRQTSRLSIETGQHERDVRRDLQYLQDCGAFDSSLVFEEGGASAAAGGMAGAGGPAPGSARWFAEKTSGVPQAPPQLAKSIRCTGCGAQNTVLPGQAKACDYCGTTIPYS